MDGWQNLAGWVAVIATLAAYAVLLRQRERRLAPSLANCAPLALPARRAPGSDWQRLAAIMDAAQAHAPAIAASQARASQQIDAAEHALNRLIKDCAAVMPVPVTPTFEPSRTLVREPAVTTESIAA